MKINSALLPFLCLSLVFSLPTSAKDQTDEVYISDNELERVSVKWISPKSFTDVEEANFSNAKFRKHVFTQLEKHLDKLAKDLPTGQTLNVSVTNVDLAGRIEPASFVGLSRSMNDVRIMRNIDIPQLTFEYELLDSSGTVLKGEKVKLKNMNYLHESRSAFRTKAFAHEKRMLSKWFAKNLVTEEA